MYIPCFFAFAEGALVKGHATGVNEAAKTTEGVGAAAETEVAARAVERL